MPHLIMEYSDPVAEQVNIRALLDDLHSVLMKSSLFEPNTVISRSYPAHNWLVGDKLDEADFIHVTVTHDKTLNSSEMDELKGLLLHTMQTQAENILIITADIR